MPGDALPQDKKKKDKKKKRSKRRHRRRSSSSSSSNSCSSSSSSFRLAVNSRKENLRLDARERRSPGPLTRERSRDRQPHSVSLKASPTYRHRQDQEPADKDTRAPGTPRAGRLLSAPRSERQSRSATPESALETDNRRGGAQLVSKSEMARRSALKSGDKRKFPGPQRAPSQSRSPILRRLSLKPAPKKNRNPPDSQPTLETLQERVKADKATDFTKAPNFVKQRAEKRAERLHQMMSNR